RSLPHGFAVVLLIFSTLGPPGGDGAASSPSIKLSRQVGPPTTRVTVKGVGFGPNEAVDITFDSGLLATATTGSTGKFTQKVQVPASALPGAHTITATGESS